eukprot:scaffold48454_cov60-Phaeocystis_antarctica.AAC.1
MRRVGAIVGGDGVKSPSEILRARRVGSASPWYHGGAAPRWHQRHQQRRLAERDTVGPPADAPWSRRSAATAVAAALRPRPAAARRCQLRRRPERRPRGCALRGPRARRRAAAARGRRARRSRDAAAAATH